MPVVPVVLMVPVFYRTLGSRASVFLQAAPLVAVL